MSPIVCALLLIILSCLQANADITSDTIPKFNIGQLFSFYDADTLCKSKTQFAVAKKPGTGNCQWKIAENFSREKLENEGDLPVRDVKGNCFFACVWKTGRPRLHTEKVINRKFVSDGIQRSDFDMYTYLAPCSKCINGPATGGETAEFDEFRAVFYSNNEEGGATVGSEVKNDELLQKDLQKGLSAIKETTKVDLDDVKKEVQDGKSAGKSKEDIVNGVEGKYLKNAVQSYLDQN